MVVTSLIPAIVFMPGSVQGPGSRFWSGHRVGQVNSLFLNQNDVVWIKKQKLTGCNRVFDRVLPGHWVNRVTPGFSLPYFFFNPARFQLRVGRVPSWPVGPSRVSKLCFLLCCIVKNSLILSLNPVQWFKLKKSLLGSLPISSFQLNIVGIVLMLPSRLGKSKDKKNQRKKIMT
jgi:hypothetical protein